MKCTMFDVKQPLESSAGGTNPDDTECELVLSHLRLIDGQ